MATKNQELEAQVKELEEMVGELQDRVMNPPSMDQLESPENEIMKAELSKCQKELTRLSHELDLIKSTETDEQKFNRQLFYFQSLVVCQGNTKINWKIIYKILRKYSD